MSGYKYVNSRAWVKGLAWKDFNKRIIECEQIWPVGRRL